MANDPTRTTSAQACIRYRGRGMSTPIEQAAKALAQLSDREWTRVKCDEERRRAQQRTIRDLSKELGDRKIDPEPARD
jgi:hypothetical protein